MTVWILILAAMLGGSGQTPTPLDLTGVWEMSVSSQEGTDASTWTLEQHREKLLLRFKDSEEEVEVEGTIKGDRVEWVLRKEFSGFSISSRYQGKVIDSDAIEGTFGIKNHALTPWKMTRKKSSPHG
jgi:hypothetical protein